jgi:hypothetical protein
MENINKHIHVRGGKAFLGLHSVTMVISKNTDWTSTSKDFKAETREQIIELKDGRTIFKTNNGFKSFVQSKKGEVTEVTNEYYNQVKINRKK